MLVITRTLPNLISRSGVKFSVAFDIAKIVTQIFAIRIKTSKITVTTKLNVCLKGLSMSRYKSITTLKAVNSTVRITG